MKNQSTGENMSKQPLHVETDIHVPRAAPGSSRRLGWLGGERVGCRLQGGDQTAWIKSEGRIL